MCATPSARQIAARRDRLGKGRLWTESTSLLQPGKHSKEGAVTQDLFFLSSSPRKHSKEESIKSAASPVTTTREHQAKHAKERLLLSGPHEAKDPEAAVKVQSPGATLALCESLHRRRGLDTHQKYVQKKEKMLVLSPFCCAKDLREPSRMPDFPRPLRAAASPESASPRRPRLMTRIKRSMETEQLPSSGRSSRSTSAQPQ